MTREGKIFVDGPHLTYDFGLGRILTIKSGSPLTIIGDLNEKRRNLGFT